MAEIVLGIGTSHSPMLSLQPELWQAFGQNDTRNKELLTPKGEHKTFDEMVAIADPAWTKVSTPEVFKKQYEDCQHGINVLDETLKAVAPDVCIIFSDDQDEIFFDDNYPAFSVFWGDKVPSLARKLPDDASPVQKGLAWGYGREDRMLDVDTELGRYLIEYLTDHDFDIAHQRRLHDEYGGTIGPSGYVYWQRDTKPRPQGIGHGYGFVVERIMNGKIPPILPININTCYPPNQPSPRRCFELGRAVAQAVKAWDSTKRVAVIGSGGLSHFMCDEELDRLVLKAFVEKDAETICNLPYERLNSATSEIRNWIACAGASWDLQAEELAYAPVRRTVAGSGGGWGFMRWLPAK